MLAETVSVYITVCICIRLAAVWVVAIPANRIELANCSPFALVYMELCMCVCETVPRAKLSHSRIFQGLFKCAPESQSRERPENKFASREKNDKLAMITAPAIGAMYIQWVAANWNQLGKFGD